MNEQSVNPSPEMPEPVFGAARLPMWPVLLLAALFFGGQLYLETYGGGFMGDNYAESLKSPAPTGDLPPEVLLYLQGQEVYAKYCSACHQPNGMGTPGQFPPLAGSEWVTGPGHARTVRIILDAVGGPMTVKGVPWNSEAMLAWRDQLKDDEIAAVTTFIRGNKDWGNNAPPVKTEQVKALRDETSGHAGRKYSAEELLKIPE
jgi:mono/diheme cytochrome c family protein